MKVSDNSSLALAEKTWDAFLKSSFVNPLVWWTEDARLEATVKYDLSLNTTNSTLIDFNSTSEMTNKNVTNIAPTYFTAADNETTLSSVTSVIDDVWGKFLDGNWVGDITYGATNMTAMGTWAFGPDNGGNNGISEVFNT